MKKILFTFLTLSFLISANTLSAQSPPPPNGGNTSESGGTPVGGGAPISGGLGILLSMGLAYAYANYQKNTKADEKI